MIKNFTDIKIGDIVLVRDIYAHDLIYHTVRVDDVELSKENIDKEFNPTGMRCYCTDLDYWDETTKSYDCDDYIGSFGFEDFSCIINHIK